MSWLCLAIAQFVKNQTMSIQLSLVALYARLYRLLTVSVSRNVAELDLSNNPILSPTQDSRGSLFIRMLGDDNYARHITALNLSQIGLRVIPDAVPACRRLVSLRLANNCISVSHLSIDLYQPSKTGFLNWPE